MSLENLSRQFASASFMDCSLPLQLAISEGYIYDLGSLQILSDSQIKHSSLHSPSPNTIEVQALFLDLDRGRQPAHTDYLVNDFLTLFQGDWQVPAYRLRRLLRSGRDQRQVSGEDSVQTDENVNQCYGGMLPTIGDSIPLVKN